DERPGGGLVLPGAEGGQAGGGVGGAADEGFLPGGEASRGGAAGVAVGVEVAAGDVPGGGVDGDRVGALGVPGQVGQAGCAGAGGDRGGAQTVVPGAGDRAAGQGQFLIGQVQRGRARVGGQQEGPVGVVDVGGVLGGAAG